MYDNLDKSIIFTSQILRFEKFFTFTSHCILSVDAVNNCLTIESPINLIDNITHLQSKISRQAYVKLGCNEVILVCCLEEIWKYYYTNTFITTDNMLTTEKLPSLATTNSDWVSFESVAYVLDVEVEQIEKIIEQQTIPGIRINGEWGLQRNSCRELINDYYTKLKSSKIDALFGEPSKFAIEADDDSHSDKSPGLPEGFSITAGRKRRPSILMGLNMALSTLPDGDTSGNKYYDYIQMLVLRDSSMKRITQELAALYSNPDQAIHEIYAVAQSLWAEHVE